MKQFLDWLKEALDILSRKGQLPSPVSSVTEPETPEAEVAIQGSLFKTVKDCTDLLGRLEDMDASLEEKAKPFASHVRINLQEIVERAGAVRIEGETAFDVIRHQAVPVCRVTSGVLILETLEPGYMFDGRVIKRAKVKLGNS
jgi:molecular chaperone GrpE (heat shock protein)